MYPNERKVFKEKKLKKEIIYYATKTKLTARPE